MRVFNRIQPMIKHQEIDSTSALLGGVSALIGSFLFALISEIWLSKNIHGNFQLFSFVFGLFLAFCYSVVPSVLAGVLLGRMMKMDFINGKHNVLKTIIRGVLIAIALVISLSGGIVILNIRMKYEFFIRYTITALIIAPIISGSASFYLSQRFHKEFHERI